MMRSMFSAISGLRVHQAMLDVTANDIANVNTVGYKGERATFKDALSQMQRGASAATANLGGTNAAQVGLGVQMSSIDNQMQSGAIQTTGNTFDLAIQGDGWFRVTDDPTGFSRIYYTRAGNFKLDDKKLKTIGLGKSPEVNEGSRIDVVVYAAAPSGLSKSDGQASRSATSKTAK